MQFSKIMHHDVKYRLVNLTIIKIFSNFASESHNVAPTHKIRREDY